MNNRDKQQGRVVISGGKVVDPSVALEDKRDICIEDGKIFAVDKPGSFKSFTDARVVDASNLIVTPGLIDVHVHLREPGYEWKETIATGCMAAVSGGFTSVCCMPNTNPINDSAQVAKFILEQAKRANTAKVFPIGAVSLGSKGETLSPLLELFEAGCVAFSDDGWPIGDPALMRAALEYCLMFDGLIAGHEEEKALSSEFSMNESALSLKLGLKGMPGAAEDVMISRDIELARLTGGRVHFCHVSTARAVTLIRRAKEDGIRVTAEVSPHHITLTEDAVIDYNTSAKMSMPLRTGEDIHALTIGLAEGVIDCIASDHAPHEMDSKRREFNQASFGIIGLQTTLPLVMQKVRNGSLSLKRAVEALTIRPAQIFGLRGVGTLVQGSCADITIINPDKEFILTEEMILSKSTNTPFMGERMQGLAIKTFVDGREVYTYNDK
jgi:dihydroorotase